jgi:hypothetical protein
MTMTTAAPAATAREALQSGQCSASCLLSQETGRCHCKCQGRHHGALLRYITTPEPEQPVPLSNRAAKRRMRRGRRRR